VTTVASAGPRKIEIQNVLSPAHIVQVDADKYDAMRRAMLKVLPTRAPGHTGREIAQAVLPHLPGTLFPGGAKAGWWLKAVQLDLEAKRIIVREDSKPLRWHRATGRR
jgi:hypothetical protein